MIYNMDCIKGAQQYLSDESCDLIIADPPYNLGFGGTTMTKSKKPRFNIIANDQLSTREYQRFTFGWLREAYRALKTGRHIYVCIDWRMYPYMALWMSKVGFTIKNCIVWDKEHMGMGWQYRYRHEFIILATKGKQKGRRVSTRKAADIWRVPKIQGNKTVHPTEKPVDLFYQMILNSSLENEHVADFFVGSGPAYEVAIKTNRRFTGFEIDEGYYLNVNKRINNLRYQKK